jgi:hypothetical protein
MWTLLKREIEDQIILFVLVIIAGISFAGWMAGVFPSMKSVPPTRVPYELVAMFCCLLSGLSIGAGVLAGLQMAGDRTRGVSRFLCTLTATRSQILLAKWIVGLAWVILGILPVALVCAILTQRWVQIVPIDTSPIVWMISGTALSILASYAFGMQAVMARRPAWVVLGGIAFTIGLMSVVVIKGFGLHTHLLAALVGLACLVRTWIQFHTIAL